MKNRIKISIITTYYNSVKLGDFVNRSMSCLLNQTYKDIEFICVNDGSHDDTLKQLNEYAQNDQRIIVINKKNEGVAQYAKAAGQDVASGDFIMLFDHDDLLSIDAIEKAVDVLKSDRTLDGVTMIVETKYVNGEIKNILNFDQLIKNSDEFSLRILTGKEMFQKTVGRYDIHFRGLIKRDIFKSVSFRYREKLLNGDEIVERLIFNNMVKVASCLGIYQHFIYNNSSAKSYNLKRTDIVKTDIILREIFKNENVFESRKNIFEFTAYRNLLNGIKVYNHFKKDLSIVEQKFYYDRLRLGYDNLDKKIVINEYSFLNRIYHSILLSSFKVLVGYYTIKN